MIELRKDYLLNRWVLVNDLRHRRPFDFQAGERKAQPSHDPGCSFCLGNEEATPPEILRIGPEKAWKMRVIPNKYPGFTREEGVAPSSDPLLVHRKTYGYHELLIETPRHDEQFWDLSPPRILEVLELLTGRIRDLKKDRRIWEVDVFKNHGRESGASLLHSHFQIMAYNHLSPLILEKMEALSRHRKEKGKCGYCDITDLERKGSRFIAREGEVIAFAPYASAFPYQVSILPVRHLPSLQEFTDAELLDTARLIHKVLSKLKLLNAPYNLYLQQVLTGEDFHFHIEITPRLNTWGGFELQTGIVVNTVPPEEAAEFYRAP